MTQRIYRVINVLTAAEHLVRAHSQAQAIRHVVAHEYRAAVAGQETIVELLTAGATVQDAGAEQSEHATLAHELFGTDKEPA